MKTPASAGAVRHRRTREPLGTDPSAAPSAAARPRRPGPPRRGGRLHGPVERRDQRARRVHPAGARRDVDRERAARDRRRRRLHPRAGAARPAGGGARRPVGRAVRARHRRILGPHRRGLERHAVRAAADADGARPSTSCDAAFAGERTPTGFKLEQAACRAAADHPRGPARKDAAPGGRAGRRSLHQLPPPGRPAARSPSSSRARPDGFELLCRFFCIPGEREQVEPLARFMFASYATVPVYEAFFRWLGYGEQIDDDGRGVGREGPRGGDRRGALGADRGHVHLRVSGGDAGAPRGATSTAGITLPILTPITTPDRMGDADRGAYAAINAGGQPPGPSGAGGERARTARPGRSTSRPSRGRTRA